MSRSPRAKINLALTAKVKRPRKPEQRFSPGVLLEGVWNGWSGYAKSCREIGHRIANTIHVEARHSIEIPWNNKPLSVRTSALEKIRVEAKCPYVRFFGPDRALVTSGRKIIYTMIESEIVHPDMVKKINSQFHELWTPTLWNVDAFVRSGVSIPCRAIPLGVNSLIYRKLPARPAMPECTLLSTNKAGEKGIPGGFVFLSLSLPSFRKGFDLLSAAFEDAFNGDPEVQLVIASTHTTLNVPALSGLGNLKAKVWGLTGEFDEHSLAKVYNAADCYVSCSRGEGWNLGICEGAACGLPVICPDNTAHPEVVGSDAFAFCSEGVSAYPGSEAVSPWYKDMPFSVFGKKSHAELVDLLRFTRCGGDEVRRRANALRLRMLTRFTWDQAAELATGRLLELNQ
jgi:glycosyltransferase involved in cell wall biosynthesis